MAGTTNPGAFRTLGLQTAANFDDAWRMARRYVGANPTTVVAPTFWTRPRIKFCSVEDMLSALAKAPSAEGSPS